MLSRGKCFGKIKNKIKSTSLVYYCSDDLLLAFHAAEIAPYIVPRAHIFLRGGTIHKSPAFFQREIFVAVSGGGELGVNYIVVNINIYAAQGLYSAFKTRNIY